MIENVPVSGSLACCAARGTSAADITMAAQMIASLKRRIVSPSLLLCLWPVQKVDDSSNPGFVRVFELRRVVSTGQRNHLLVAGRERGEELAGVTRQHAGIGSAEEQERRHADV